MMHTHLLNTKTSTLGTSSRKDPSERYPVSCSSQDDCPTFRSQETLRKSKNAILRGALYTHTPLPQRGSLEEQAPTWRPSQKTELMRNRCADSTLRYRGNFCPVLPAGC